MSRVARIFHRAAVSARSLPLPSAVIGSPILSWQLALSSRLAAQHRHFTTPTKLVDEPTKSAAKAHGANAGASTEGANGNGSNTDSMGLDKFFALLVGGGGVVGGIQWLSDYVSKKQHDEKKRLEEQRRINNVTKPDVYYANHYQKKLESAFKAKSHVLIHGLSGSGKTTLAESYAGEHTDEYAFVRMLDASNPDALISGLEALYIELENTPADVAISKLPAYKTAKKEEKVACLTDRLREHLIKTGEKTSLLILDNVTANDSILECVQKRLHDVHIIITSKRGLFHSTSDGTASIECGGLKPDERKQFFMSLFDIESGEKELGPAFKELISYLPHPVGLKPAAKALIEKRAIRPSYRIAAFLKELRALHPDTKTITQEDVFTLYFNELKTEETQVLMQGIAFLAPLPIPVQFLVRYFDRLYPGDDSALNKALYELEDKALIQVHRKGITIESVQAHEYVQVSARKKWPMLSRSWQAWLQRKPDTQQALLETLIEACKLDEKRLSDVTYRDGLSNVLQHAQILLNRPKEAMTASHGILMRQCGFILWELGKASESKKYCEEALHIQQSVYFPDQLEIALTNRVLGNALYDLGDFKGTKAHFERALAIQERYYGRDHHLVATTVGNLGNALYSLGNVKGAKAHHERALAIQERYYGHDHYLVARTVMNLGSALSNLGDVKGAKAHYERALAIQERYYGHDHPEVARTVINLGDLLCIQGNFREAKTCVERALPIQEANYGKEHFELVIPTNNLGDALVGIGDIDKARVCYRRALRIANAAYPDGHWLLDGIKANLAKIDTAHEDRKTSVSSAAIEDDEQEMSL